ncbi:MAG: hypothetical protein WBD55_01125 [Dehalococcoidia bacterium]
MERLPVFVSRPNDLSARQEAVWQELDDFLQKRGIVARVIGSTDHPNVAPLAFILEVMRHCQGAIILGIRQTLVHEAVLKVETPKEQHVKGVFLPTPWNHLEAGVALQLGLPLMIIREAGVAEEGIFDPRPTDRFIHAFDLSSADWITDERFLQPFNAWYADVLRRAGSG